VGKEIKGEGLSYVVCGNNCWVAKQTMVFKQLLSYDYDYTHTQTPRLKTLLVVDHNRAVSRSRCDNVGDVRLLHVGELTPTSESAEPVVEESEEGLKLIPPGPLPSVNIQALGQGLDELVRRLINQSLVDAHRRLINQSLVDALLKLACQK
jgi:hypothetical protein